MYFIVAVSKNYSCMKKIVFSFLFVTIINFSFGQRWGANFYLGQKSVQEYSTWCVFACIEMKTQKSHEQCNAATMYVHEFHSTSIDCCEKFPDDHASEEYNKFCLHGVDLLKCPHFLGIYHKAMPLSITNISSTFKYGEHQLFYPLPCYGFINSLHHCVLVYGIEATIEGLQKLWKVYYIDPYDGSSKYLRVYENDTSIQLICII